ncbi:MAG: hypothetical protein LBS81_04685 [Endomicrobium sp.]|jgi:hypothetical protein|nr:hypothetical protein [Endomicrobium sp.]
MLGLGVAGNYKITDNIGIFAKADFYIATRYANSGGTIDANYKFWR